MNFERKDKYLPFISKQAREALKYHLGTHQFQFLTEPLYEAPWSIAGERATKIQALEFALNRESDLFSLRILSSIAFSVLISHNFFKSKLIL